MRRLGIVLKAARTFGRKRYQSSRRAITMVMLSRTIVLALNPWMTTPTIRLTTSSTSAATPVVQAQPFSRKAPMPKARYRVPRTASEIVA
jgi:hypothetical protein